MILEIRNLHAGYGKIKVLRDVSMEVAAGEIVSIVGPNGAGKSTVLRSIAGVIRPMSGSIRYDGDEISTLKITEIVRKGLAFVPQGRSVFPSLTVEENLEMGAFIRTDTAEIKRDMDGIYQRFPILRERKKQPAVLMSGGEQQMLSLGRALILNPRILLLDEPTLGLAPMVCKEIFSKISEINKEKTTVMIVEQNAFGALQICHRGYVLELGRNRMMDSGENLLNNEQVKKLYLGA